MEWTQDKPTETGAYWEWDPLATERPPQLWWVDCGLAQAGLARAADDPDDTEWTDSSYFAGAWWYGPISPPRTP